MLIVISGPSCVGKSFVVSSLCERFGFFTAVPYTSRPPRPSESEGFHYHFRSEQELRELSAGFSRGYWDRPLGEHWYGYTDHIDRLVDNPTNWVIQASSDAVISMKRNNPHCIAVFIDFKTEETFHLRIKERFGKSAKVLDERVRHAEKERSNSASFDYVLTSDNPELLLTEVAAIAFSRVVESPVKKEIVGTIDAAGILSSMNDPDGIRVDGIDSGRVKNQVHGCSLDLTLARKYYRISHPMPFAKPLDLAILDEQDVVKLFVEHIAGQYEGITLKAGEFILATSEEKLTIPNWMMGIISGRGSYARLGISVHLGSTILHPCHCDTVPLQILNNLPYPVIIYPGIAIAQVSFFTLPKWSVSENGEFSFTASVCRTGVLGVRSRYFDDPLYETIRSKKPVKVTPNWSMTLNILLFLSSIGYIASWVTKNNLSVSMQPIAQHIEFSLLMLTVLMGVVRLILLGISLITKK